MHIAKRPITKHRRARLIACALAMLAWMASVLFAGAPFKDRHERQRGDRMSLERLTRTVKMLVASRARDLVRRRPPSKLVYWRQGRCLARAGMFRAMIGSRMRRALKRKAIGERIAVLIDALMNIDYWADRLAKRARRGLTKRWSVPPAPTSAAPLAALAASEAFVADSS